MFILSTSLLARVPQFLLDSQCYSIHSLPDAEDLYSFLRVFVSEL